MKKITKPEVQKMNLADVDNKTARKLVAQDILDCLDAKFMVANKGTYVAVPKEEHLERFLEDPYGADVSCPFIYQEEIKEDSAQNYVESFPVCGVCAIGSLLVATILRFNAVTLRELGEVAVGYRSDAMQYLQRLFTPVELGMMEACFENDSYTEWMLYDDKEYIRNNSLLWRSFFNKFSTPDERLRGIMQNILNNDGEFKPEAI